MAENFDPNIRLTATQLSDLSGRSGRWIATLRAEGYFGDVARSSSLTLAEFMAGVMRYYEAERERGTKADAARAASVARTEKIRMEIAMLQRDLISLSDAEAVLTEFAGHVRMGIASLPTIASRDPAVRKAIQKAADDLLLSLSERAAEAGEGLASDRGDPAPLPEENPV